MESEINNKLAEELLDVPILKRRNTSIEDYNSREYPYLDKDYLARLPMKFVTKGGLLIE